jgi:hypothetical protein
MNELIPEMAPVPAFKNRSTGLIIFGILTILLGGLTGLMLLLMIVQTAVAKTATPTPFAALLMVIFIYATLAAALIWLGIGSIMARRWARALLLIFSWVWLIMGIVMVITMACVLPKVMENLQATSNGQPALPPGAITGVVMFMILVLGFFFILVPAVWIFFYSSRHVKATCEARDPVTRWTDACPLPVLALSLWLWFSVPMFLLLPLMGHGVIPFFGTFLSSLPGSLVCLVLALLWAYSAWLLYKLDVRGWWLVLVMMVVWTASTILTYARHGMIEMYQRMGYPQDQIDEMQRTGLFAGNWMIWFMVLFIVPFLGYMLFVKKYLRSDEAPIA